MHRRLGTNQQSQRATSTMSIMSVRQYFSWEWTRWGIRKRRSPKYPASPLHLTLVYKVEILGWTHHGRCQHSRLSRTINHNKLGDDGIKASDPFSPSRTHKSQEKWAKAKSSDRSYFHLNRSYLPSCLIWSSKGGLVPSATREAPTKELMRHKQQRRRTILWACPCRTQRKWERSFTPRKNLRVNSIYLIKENSWVRQIQQHNWKIAQLRMPSQQKGWLPIRK